MHEVQPRRSVEGDHKAMLFIASIAVGSIVMVLVEAVVGRGVRGEALGFLGMWGAIFPFARRTWAAAVPAWHYWALAVAATAIGAALRLLTR
jgi:hypothetical protein